VKVKKITFTSWSSWAYAVILTCDDQLAIWFLRGGRTYRTPGGRYFRIGGVPGVCCLYPGVPGPEYYELLVVWTPGPGEFVWHVLPYQQPYRLVEPPTPPYGCGTEVSVDSSVNPSCRGNDVTWTAEVVDEEGLGTPEGTVTFYDGTTLLGTGTALTGSGDRATSTFTASTLTTGTHTIRAVFTPAEDSGFAEGEGSTVQGVQDCGGTETEVNSSFTPSCTGHAVTWTAAVTNAEGMETPEGTVEFFDGGTSLGPGSALTGSGDSATSSLTSTALTAGSHVIRAVYTPAADSDFMGSEGYVVQEVQDCGGGGGGGECFPLSGADLFSSASSAVGNNWVPACNYGADGTYDLSGPHVGSGDRWRLYLVKTTSTGGTVLPPVFTGNNLEATLVASGTVDAVGNLVGVPASISVPTCEQTCDPIAAGGPCDDFAVMAVWVCLCTACPGGDFEPIDFGPYGTFQP
jgi:hypothetical protein